MPDLERMSEQYRTTAAALDVTCQREERERARLEEAELVLMEFAARFNSALGATDRDVLEEVRAFHVRVRAYFDSEGP